MSPIKSLVKQAAFQAGRRFQSENFSNFIDCLNIGSWVHAQGYNDVPVHPTRVGIFHEIASKVAHEKVLYLEFGVYKGRSMQLWSELLKNPESRLFGFDSFEGLPESWIDYQKGHFSTNGRIPTNSDPRVTFVKGWFNQTLPDFKPPAHDRLVLNMDADLYSSTIYVLNHLKELIKPGTYIYFDEFRVRDHELKAFTEFVEATGARFVPIGQSNLWVNAAFRKES